MDSLMQLFTGPFFDNRLGLDWVSHSNEYWADMMERLDKLQDAGNFWRLSPIEKLGFSVAVKLKLL